VFSDFRCMCGFSVAGDAGDLSAARDRAAGRQFVAEPADGSVDPDEDEDDGLVYPPISALDGHLGDDDENEDDEDAGDGVPINGIDGAGEDGDSDEGDDGGADGGADDGLDFNRSDDDDRQPDRKKPRLGGSP
jgi:hypothetical protein